MPLQKLLSSLLFLVLTAGCSANEPRIVYVTATPDLGGAAQLSQVPEQQLSPIPQEFASNPTPNPPRTGDNPVTVQQHEVQAGDTLYGIAQQYGISIESLLSVNDLPNPDSLYVGQIINLPGLPNEQSPDFKIIPDSRLVRGPGSAAFDVFTFVSQQPGYVRMATDDVVTRQADGSELHETLTSAQAVERVALEFSVDPRLLLALLEYRAGWLSNPNLPEHLISYPMISGENSAGIDRSGLYLQLSWTANMLNYGYYGWNNEGWTILEFETEERVLYAPGLNAGTVGIQYMLSEFTSYGDWLQQIAPGGVYSIYYAYFGDPFADAVDPIMGQNLQQPDLTFPFSQGETWFFTGGAHGGWGAGSAWAAVDFAPPDDPVPEVACYTSDFWVTAVATGLIARSENGAVILDLDEDGDEATGWTILYLHIATDGRVASGTRVQTGDRIGHPSCEGGFSTATHMHIARRYNGEWIPAYCHACSSEDARPPFVMNDWTVIGFRNQEYQGYLERNGERRVAEQGRLSPDNRVSW